MSDHHHPAINHSGDEEEEDLEFLRLAALKSLQNKKDHQLNDNSPSSLHYKQYEKSPQHFSSHNKSAVGVTLPSHSSYSITRSQQQYNQQHQLSDNTYKNHNENFYGTGGSGNLQLYHHPSSGNSSLIPITQNNLGNYANRQRLKKLDINEPYVPHCLQPLVLGHSAIHSSVNTGWMNETVANGNHNVGYHPSAPYVAPKNISHDSGGGGGITNVQLSPRSLAFVAQNNDILARRKGGDLSPASYSNRSPICNKSPNYRIGSSPLYNRSPSPCYRSTPGRWSTSPTSKHHYRRSISRSPPSQGMLPSRPRSPAFKRRRPLSRSSLSPLQDYRQLSPNYNNYSSRSPPHQNVASKRTKSRSPLASMQLKHRSPISHPMRRSRSPPIHGRHVRKLSRSPTGSLSSQRNISRHCSPSTNTSSRYAINKHRSPAIHYNKRRLSPATDNTSDMRQNRGRSPISSSVGNSQQQNKNIKKRKSLSPLNQQHRNRSRTPHSSPLRKYSQVTRERNIGQMGVQSKRSPIDKKRKNDPNSIIRNRNERNRRSQSPHRSSGSSNNNNRKNRSRSRNSEKSRRGEDYYYRKKIERNSTGQFKKQERKFEKHENINFNNKQNTTTDKKVKHEIEILKNDENRGDSGLEIASELTSLTPPLQHDEENLNYLATSENIKEILNDNKDSTNDGEDNKNNSSDDDDGIDLFPSDESESENEGRFKSSTNRNERKTNIPTLSFAKLNESSVPNVVKDLQDVCNNKNSRGRSGDDRFNRRRDDRFKKNENSRNSRNDRRRNNDLRRRKSRSHSRDRKLRDDTGSGRNDNRRGELNNSADDKRKNQEKPMFKSTFQAVESELTRMGSKIMPKAERSSSQEKLNSTEKNKKRLRDSEDSLAKYHHQKQKHATSSTSLKRSLKSSLSTIENLDKHNFIEGNTIDPNIDQTGIGNNGERSDSLQATANGKKSIHLRLGAMTNTFKSAKKTSTWTPSSSSSTPPTSSLSDKV